MELTNLLNRIGIILEYLAFWFAAPEILGEERLSKLEQLAARLLTKLLQYESPRRQIGLWLAVLVIASLALYLGFILPASADKIIVNSAGAIAITWTLFILVLIVKPERELTDVNFHGERNITVAIYLLFSILAFILVAVLLWLEKRPASIGDFFDLLRIVFQPSLIATAVLLPFSRFISPTLWLIEKFNGRRVRQHSLYIGIVIFHLGMGLQFLATFY